MSRCFPARNLFALLALLAATASAAPKTCTPSYCCCTGACPDSFAPHYASSSTIKNDVNEICYAATEAGAFGIGGDSITIHSTGAVLSPNDLDECPENPPEEMIPLTNVAAVEEQVSGASTSSPLVATLVAGALGWIMA